MRLDVYLAEKMREQTRSQIQKKIGQNKVEVNGRPRKSSFLLSEGDRVEITIDPPENGKILPENIPLQILHSDEHLIVLEKPSGMVVHPGAGRRKGTLVNALLHHFPEIQDVGPLERPGIIHRLDKETSGLMVVARSDEARRELQQQFKQRTVDKIYLGVVWGNIQKEEGIIDWSVGRHAKRGDKMSIKSKKPRSAETQFKTLRRFQRYTYLEIKPVTGRTHQIRVHLAASGHPIVGDTRYGKKKIKARVSRLFLHAHRLVFFHPLSSQKMDFLSPLPFEMEKFLLKLGGNIPK
jgi:23S rRNA pseudouridine1911/1915/1917 synthase